MIMYMYKHVCHAILRPFRDYILHSIAADHVLRDLRWLPICFKSANNQTGITSLEEAST